MTTTVIATASVNAVQVTNLLLGGVTYLAARFDVDVVSVGAIRLGPVMDAIAAKVPSGATERVYAWPVETASPPCAIVAYPEEPIRVMTLQRGGDRAMFPLFFLTGKTTDRTARDVISAVISGASSIADAIDGDLTEVT